VLGWCVLQWLAESVDAAQPERTALDLFDRLRLREPLGHAFTTLGFRGEEAWRVVARIKVLLLTSAGVGKPQVSASASEGADFVAPVSRPGSPTSWSSTGWGGRPAVPVASTLPDVVAADSEIKEGKPVAAPSHPEQDQPTLTPALWLDPDVRWLCGVHETDGHDYLIREQYEALLWWLLLPVLLHLAGETAPSRAAVEELSKTVATALHAAETAGYRVETLLGPLAARETCEVSKTAKSPAPEPAPDDPDASAE